MNEKYPVGSSTLLLRPIAPKTILMKYLLALTFGLLPFCGYSQAASSPNVILLMCDDLGWGDVGFNGNERVRTPHLDSLAQQGMVFRRFYSASPVCSPTRGSCLTGRNPYRYGIPTANAGHMLEEEITLAELLQDTGYRTGHFGKWHLGTLTTQVKDANRGRPGDSAHYALPTRHGFDTYFSTESKVPTFDPMWKPQAFKTPQGESLRFGWAAMENPRSGEAYGTYYWKGEEQRVAEGLSGDNSKVIMDQALRFMEQANNDQSPFFSVIWLHTPHLPVVADVAHRALFPGLSHREQIYYGTIAAMDEQIGRLWQQLEAWGIADNTLLCFASDNGPERDTPGSSGPFRERKRSLHEGGVRVPAFWVWPNMIAPGTQTDVAAVTHDYLPTLVDLLALSYPKGRPLDGISLKAVISGKQKKRHQPIGFQFQKKQSWVTHRYKLITKDEGATWELYDLLQDPEEQHNKASRKPGRVRHMREALKEWVADCERSEKEEDY